MYPLLKQFLTEWNSGKNQRTKLQQAYIMIVILIAIVAGFLSLLNDTLGRNLMFFAAIIAATYVINGVVWALLDAFVAPALPTNSKKSRKD